MKLKRNLQINNLVLGLIIVGVSGGALFIIQSLFFKIQDQAILDKQTQQEENVLSDDTLESDSLKETPHIPPFTDSIRQQLEASQGFSALISYTDHGFEPASLTLHAGEAVRFSNNSNTLLRIVSVNSDCGLTAINICRDVKPREFFEVSFLETGTWTYRVAGSALQTIKINVE